MKTSTGIDGPTGNKSASVTGLDSFAQAITYILCEIEANPSDSLRDIANEALVNCSIPLACNEDLSVEPHKWEDD